MRRRFGKYEVVSLLATGGMGEVYLARLRGARGFVKPVVVKAILESLSGDPQFVRMFLDEARLAARLGHPNIAAIYDLGRDGDRYFLAMEHVEGRDLFTVQQACLEQGERLPAAQAVHIAAQVCAGLHHAHTMTDLHGTPLHIVHRDICPQNIMVSFEGVAKVIDFGIAHAAVRLGHTQPGVVKGKFDYMSPEQCTGRPVDARTDIFSLGVVLWELLTGRGLRDGETDLGKVLAVERADIPPVRSIESAVSEELDSIVTRATARVPADRFEDAFQMQCALEDTLRLREESLGPTPLAGYMSRLFPEKEPVFPEPPAPDQATVPTRAERFWTDPATSPRRPDAPPRKCPKCINEIMEPVEASGIGIERCPVCHGIFLDPGELHDLLRRKLGEKIDNHIFSPTPELMDTARAYCAVCGFEMELVQGPFAVFFEHCPSCHTIFLDAGELASLQRLPDTMLPSG